MRMGRKVRNEENGKKRKKGMGRKGKNENGEERKK